MENLFLGGTWVLLGIWVFYRTLNNWKTINVDVLCKIKSDTHNLKDITEEKFIRNKNLTLIILALALGCVGILKYYTTIGSDLMLVIMGIIAICFQRNIKKYTEKIKHPS